MEQVYSWITPIREFYLCGFNVFDNELSVEKKPFDYHLEPDRYSDIDNSYVEHADVRSATLSHYLLKGYDFYVATSAVGDYYLITIFADNREMIPFPDDKTHERIREYMLDRLVSNEAEGVLYSGDKSRRIILEQREDGRIGYSLERITPNNWALLDFPKYASELLTDYYFFECLETCIFDTMENAVSAAKKELEESQA